jgi:predicted glycoside hydrolase/deacetylase ChbG (UPF0249 family)
MAAPLCLRRLVVNADDAGIDVRRNDGILEAHRHGVVSSATVLVTGPAFQDFVARALHCPSLGVGLHLNLSACCPPAAGVRIPGAFTDKETLWVNALACRLDPALVEAELVAQIELALAAGLVPTHVDGHNHVHAFPCVAEVLDRLTSRYPFVGRRRVPREYAGVPGLGEKSRRFAGIVCERPASIAGPECFAGFCLEERCSVQAAIEVLRACPGRSLELMVHPGHTAADSIAFSREPGRESELLVLTSPELVAWVREQGIELVHYGAFPLAPR